jgi:AraC-like DNA-binding protein
MSDPVGARRPAAGRRRERTGGKLVHTRDLAEAQALITDVYIPHDLRSRDGRPLDFTMSFLQSHKLTVGHLNYGADAELLVPAMLDCYHLNLTLGGATQVAQAGRSAATSAGRRGVLFGPQDPFSVRWSPEAVQYAIKLPRRSLEDHLAGLLNQPVDGPVRFALVFDMTAAAGRNLLSAVHFLRNELDRPGGLASSPLARDQLESFVMTQVLLAVPHEHRDRLLTPTAPAQRTRVGRVIDLIDAHPDAPLSLPDLTRVAGVGARALQEGFRETVGMAPLAYVRKVRLDRVRAELQETAGERSVTDVALRWGFSHLGRFAGQYRAQFGEAPSETVRSALRAVRTAGSSSGS